MVVREPIMKASCLADMLDGKQVLQKRLPDKVKVEDS